MSLLNFVLCGASLRSKTCSCHYVRCNYSHVQMGPQYKGDDGRSSRSYVANEAKGEFLFESRCQAIFANFNVLSGGLYAILSWTCLQFGGSTVLGKMEYLLASFFPFPGPVLSRTITPEKDSTMDQNFCLKRKVELFSHAMAICLGVEDKRAGGEHFPTLAVPTAESGPNKHYCPRLSLGPTGDANYWWPGNSVNGNYCPKSLWKLSNLAYDFFILYHYTTVNIFLSRIIKTTYFSCYFSLNLELQSWKIAI